MGEKPQIKFVSIIEFNTGNLPMDELKYTEFIKNGS